MNKLLTALLLAFTLSLLSVPHADAGPLKRHFRHRHHHRHHRHHHHHHRGGMVILK